MSTARVEEHEEHEGGGVVLNPDVEAALEQVIAETDENDRAGRVIPLDKFLADRGMG